MGGAADGAVVAGRRPLVHWLMLLALVSMWGSSFLLMKIALAAYTPAQLAAGRLVLAALILAALALLGGRRPPRSARAWAFLLAMALVGNALPFWLIGYGQQTIDSGLAGILMAIMPLSTILLAHFLVEGERLSGAKAGGFLLGFVGIVVLMGPAALLELRGEGTLIAQLAVLGGAFCYACNTIITRRRPAEGDALTAAACVLVLASTMMTPVALAAGPPPPSPPLGPTIALVLLALWGTAIPTVVYFRLIAAAGPSFLSFINYLIPLWAVLLGMVALGERPKASALLALALILAGIATSELGGRAAARRAGRLGKAAKPRP